MQRVLSFPAGMSARGFGESSEFVTKRMCFSFIFFFGFLALLGGFLLGRMSTDKKVQKYNEGLANERAATELKELQYDVLFKELENTSFERFPLTKELSEINVTQDDYLNSYKFVKSIITNSSLFSKIVEQKSSLLATLKGSQEPDRWIVLSVSGDGTIPALELVKILEKLKADNNWKPQRTIIFCFSDNLRDSCRDMLPRYSKSRIIAYLAIHGNAIQKKGCLIATGSDIIESIVLGTIQELISESKLGNDQAIESCELTDDSKARILVPRLYSDIPHTSLSFKTSNSTSSEFSSDKEISPYRRTLVQIIGLSIWKLSDSVYLQWDPKDFQSSVRTALKMINSSKFNEVKEKIISTTEELANNMESLNQRINRTEKDCSLDSRMANDVLMDLDRALLCPDIDFRSKTDPALISEILSKPQETISSFLTNMLECYEDAMEVLQKGRLS